MDSWQWLLCLQLRLAKVTVGLVQCLGKAGSFTDCSLKWQSRAFVSQRSGSIHIPVLWLIAERGTSGIYIAPLAQIKSTPGLWHLLVRKLPVACSSLENYRQRVRLYPCTFGQWAERINMKNILIKCKLQWVTYFCLCGERPSCSLLLAYLSPLEPGSNPGRVLN